MAISLPAKKGWQWRYSLHIAAAFGKGGPHSSVGRLAQLVEHLVYTERVSGSSPLAPTIAECSPFIGQKGLTTQIMAMIRQATLATALLLAPLCVSPAMAAYVPVIFKAKSQAPAPTLVRTKAEKEVADAKRPVCKPAIQPMTEGRRQRDLSCPKPRPILM
jgi:hypothetical protein